MKLRSFALVFAAALTATLACSSARAQSGIFVTFESQQFTQEGIYAHPGTHTNIDRPFLYGAGYGAYYTIHKVPVLNRVPIIKKFRPGPLNIGFDGRGETLRLSEYGSRLARQDGYLSLRFSPKKEMHGMMPYALGGFGIGHTSIPYQTHYQNNLAYIFGVGVDRKIHEHIDWRIVEADGGFLSQYTVGVAPLPNQSNYQITLGTGLVFRIKR
ncbi:MAG TPA: hypothetical protein VG714_00340 [Acidobacteriaceae bacterium]|nr:hypothetical protein [Acidobacteriaceae bacterium]